MQNRFKNRSKHKAQKISEKTQKISQNGTKRPPGISRKIPEIAPEAPRDVPGDPWDPQRTLKGPHSSQKDVQRAQKSPKGPQMTPKRLQGTPLGSTKASERQQKRHLTDTPKEPKLKIENRCNRHRHNDSIDATLKQHYVENDLGPAECAERSNTAGPLRASAVFWFLTGLEGRL